MRKKKKRILALFAVMAVTVGCVWEYLATESSYAATVSRQASDQAIGMSVNPGRALIAAGIALLIVVIAYSIRHRNTKESKKVVDIEKA